MHTNSEMSLFQQAICPWDGMVSILVIHQTRDHKNMLRLSMFVIAMVTLLLCAVLCIFSLRGTGGWVSLSVAAFVIFLVTVVAIDKIE